MAAWMLPAAVMGSSLLSGAMSYLGQSDANEANREIAREQMAFQERMSNTAYQRSMEDMRAAGLNPMLAYSKGGASTPTGASAVMQNALAGAADHVRGGVSSALMSAKLDAEIDNLHEQNQLLKNQQANVAADTLQKYASEGNIRADTILKGSQTNLTEEQGHRTRLELPNVIQTGRNLNVQEGILRSQAQSAQAEATRDLITEEMLREYPQLRQLDMLLQTLGLGRRAVGR